MRNHWMWALLAVWFANSAAAQTLDIDGVAFNVPALPGYCVTRDQGLLDELRQMDGDVERCPLAISATCGDIARFNAGGALEGWRSIIWSVRTTENGSVFRLPSGLTRWDFAETRSNSREKLDMRALIGEVNKRLSGQPMGFRMTKIGVIARDPDAVYAVALIDNGSELRSSIFASTEIHRLQMTISASDSLSDSTALSALLFLVQRATRAAVADNPD